MRPHCRRDAMTRSPTGDCGDGDGVGVVGCGRDCVAGAPRGAASQRGGGAGCAGWACRLAARGLGLGLNLGLDLGLGLGLGRQHGFPATHVHDSRIGVLARERVRARHGHGPSRRSHGLSGRGFTGCSWCCCSGGRRDAGTGTARNAIPPVEIEVRACGCGGLVHGLALPPGMPNGAGAHRGYSVARSSGGGPGAIGRRHRLHGGVDGKSVSREAAPAPWTQSLARSPSAVGEGLRGRVDGEPLALALASGTRAS